MTYYGNQLDNQNLIKTDTATYMSQIITQKPHSVTLYSSDKDGLPNKKDSTSLLLLYTGVYYK